MILSNRDVHEIITSVIPQLRVALGWERLPRTGRGYLQNLGKRSFKR